MYIMDIHTCAFCRLWWFQSETCCVFFQSSLHFSQFCQASGDWKLSWDAGTAQGSVASASEGTARCGIVRALRVVERYWEMLRAFFLSTSSCQHWVRGGTDYDSWTVMVVVLFFELVRSSLFLRSAFVCCTSVTPSSRCSWQSESWCQVLSTDRCERSESNRQLYGNGARREHFASWHYPSCGNRSTQSHCMLSIVEWEFMDFNGLSTPLISWQRCIFSLDSFSFFSPRSSIADFVPNIGNIFSGFGNLFRWQKANWIRAVRELLPERQNEVRQVCLAKL